MDKLQCTTATFLLMMLFADFERFPAASARFMTPNYTLSNARRQHYCGEVLTNTLELVCKGSYNHMYEKKSGEGSDSELLAAIKDSQIFRSRQLAKAFIPGALRRERRGVVDECCKNPCTINEMYTYCEQPSLPGEPPY